MTAPPPAASHRRPLRTILVVLAGFFLAGSAVAAHAATSPPARDCSLSVRDADTPGGTPAYALTVTARGTSCATATRVMNAFHRCRTAPGSGCARKIAGGWRCSGHRDRSKPTLRGQFSCASGTRGVTGTYRQDTPACFGAAARDPKLPCSNPTRSMFPPLGTPDPDLTWGCRPVPGACVFGVSEARARGHFVIIGDSHNLHWRSALAIVAQAERLRGYVFEEGGCFFSDIVGSFSSGCASWYGAGQTFVASHPEIGTVFVTQNADTPVDVPEGETTLEYKIGGFRRAWEALPMSVEHVIALRDTTITTQETIDCVIRVVKAGLLRPGPSCAVPRSVALREDAAVETVRRLRSPRYRSIDLSNYLCGSRSCYPVVGGVLVNGDIYGHLNPTFMRTLGPYLLREVRRIIRPR